MQHTVTYDAAGLLNSAGHRYFCMLGPEQGCKGDCAAGISLYEEMEFSPLQAHPFQEGFYVIEGSGYGLVDGMTFPIRKDTSFLVPAESMHAIRSDGTEGPVRVFWFHSA